MTISTLGYQKRDLDAFIDILLDAGVDVVVDVRETAWSRKKGFSKKALSTRLREAGIDYIHARFAGNPKSIRRQAESHKQVLRDFQAYLLSQPDVISAFDELITSLLEATKKPCLVCYERHPKDCHRSILLEVWQDATSSPVHIEHLATEGLPRLVKTDLFDVLRGQTPWEK